jgi:hypothetical protein
MQRERKGKHDGICRRFYKLNGRRIEEIENENN